MPRLGTAGLIIDIPVVFRILALSLVFVFLLPHYHNMDMSISRCRADRRGFFLLDRFYTFTKTNFMIWIVQFLHGLPIVRCRYPFLRIKLKHLFSNL